MVAAPFGEGNRGGGECSGKREGAAREEEGRGDTRREGEARERLGGSRRWPRRHRRSPPSCFGARGGRRQGGGGGLGRQVGELGRLQVSGPGTGLSLSLL